MTARADFIARYKGSLLDSVRAFADADLERHADIALAALSQIKPKRCTTVVSLVVWRSLYPCPANLRGIHACYWGAQGVGAAVGRQLRGQAAGMVGYS